MSAASDPFDDLATVAQELLDRVRALDGDRDRARRWLAVGGDDRSARAEMVGLAELLLQLIDREQTFYGSRLAELDALTDRVEAELANVRKVGREKLVELDAMTHRKMVEMDEAIARLAISTSAELSRIEDAIEQRGLGRNGDPGPTPGV